MLGFALALAACGDSSTSHPADANGNASIDAPAGSGIDAASVSPDGSVGVVCGGTGCSSTQECCVTNAGQSCVDTGTCAGTVLSCDSNNDCTTPGQVCCYDLGGSSSQCTAMNACDTPTCQTSADCPHANQMCCPVNGTNICAETCPQ